MLRSLEEQIYESALCIKDTGGSKKLETLRTTKLCFSNWELNRCSIKSDCINLVAPAGPAY